MGKWFYKDLVGQADAAFVSLTCPHSDGLHGFYHFKQSNTSTKEHFCKQQCVVSMN